MKKPTIIFGTLLIMAFVVVVVLFNKGSDVLLDASTKTGSDVARVAIIVDDWSLNPFLGVASVKGVSMGQPEGFGDDHSFSVGEFTVDLKPLSLFGDRLKIETILIDKPTLNLVLIGDDSNFGKMQKNIDQALSNSEEGTLKLTLDDFYLNDTTVNIKSDVYGNHEVTLADIHLENIGVDEGGVAPAEVLRLVMAAIKPQVGKLLLELGIRNRLSNEFDERIGDQLNEQLEKLPDPLKDAADLLKSGFGD